MRKINFGPKIKENTPILHFFLIQNFVEKPSKASKFKNRFFPDNELSEEFISKENFKTQINKELDLFRKILTENNSKVIKDTKSTSNFWINNSSTLPYLSDLSLHSINISSSAAYIESCFSICGFVEDRRRMNITLGLFLTRCMLRANIHIL